MGRYWRSSSTVPLAIVALTCATFAVYLFSILWQGHWKYHELLPWLSLAAIGGIISLVIIAFILRQGLAAVSRLTALLIMLCSTSAAGIFYGVLANCHLSCGSRIISEVPNRTGKVKAVWFSRKCVAMAKYCPSLSYVSIIKRDETLPNTEGETLTIDVYDGLRLEWKSDDRLVVWYPGPARVLRHQAVADGIHFEYRPVGGM